MFGPGAPVVHIDLDAHEIAKNFPVDLGLVADPKLSLAALGDALADRMTPDQKSGAAGRATEIGKRKAAELDAGRRHDHELHDEVPVHASMFAEQLRPKLPADAVIFDEALTTSPELTRYLEPTAPGSYYLTRGGSLGVGFPGAIGLKLANPEKTVIGFSGDGGAMYTYQALATAARHGIAAKFVVCNNDSYELLKVNIREYWGEREIPAHDPPAPFDLAEPDIRFDDMARSLGVQAARVDTPEKIGPAIEQMLNHPGPFLIDLLITNRVPHAKAIRGANRA
jgi:benzoylformate decarboxylase